MINQLIITLAQISEPPNQATGGALERVMDFIFLLVGVLSLIFLLVGAFRYVISAGDPQKISQAKDTILYAIIGLVVASSAFLIVNFVFGQVGDSSSTQPDTEASLLVPVVHAQPSSDDLCPDGVDNEICTPQTNETAIFRTVINTLSLLIGAAAVIMIIVGGFMYVTSGGDAESTKKAKNTIIYALVGLIVAALAQIALQFVVREVSDIQTPEEQAAEETSFLINP